ETGCRGAILKILGCNSGSVIDNKYRAPRRARHTPGVYDMRISQLGNAMDIRLKIFPIKASGSGGAGGNYTRCCNEQNSSYWNGGFHEESPFMFESLR